MIRLTCPQCNEDSYITKVDVFKTCPYCGCVFSGKYGIEKRKEKRRKYKVPFLFQYGGESFQASTVDISKQGLGIKISGFPPIEKGKVLELAVENQQFKAVVIRTEKLINKLFAGLKRLN